MNYDGFAVAWNCNTVAPSSEDVPITISTNVKQVNFAYPFILTYSPLKTYLESSYEKLSFLFIIKRKRFASQFMYGLNPEFYWYSFCPSSLILYGYNNASENYEKVEGKPLCGFSGSWELGSFSYSILYCAAGYLLL